jgi:hypothetical protein
MKKNVIRITESELRQYIQKAINEQEQPNSSVNELLNKNIQLYVDKNKQEKSHMVKITKVDSKNYENINYVMFEVQDLNFTSDTGTARPSAQDGKGRITKMQYSCRTPNYLTVVQDGKAVVNFSPALATKLKGLLNCQPSQMASKPVAPVVKPKPTVVKNVADFD